jgi:hypothetical protein
MVVKAGVEDVLLEVLGVLENSNVTQNQTQELVRKRRFGNELELMFRVLLIIFNNIEGHNRRYQKLTVAVFYKASRQEPNMNFITKFRC